MKVATFDAQLQRTNVLPFGSEMGSPLDIVSHPINGDLVYISLELGEHRVNRLRYLPGNQVPEAELVVAPNFGPAPLTVHLDGRGSDDPDGDELTYFWDLGDGRFSVQPELDHVYTGAISYHGSLTVTDTIGESDTEHFLVSPDNSPPEIVALTSPLDDDYFAAGIPLFLRSNVTDVQDDGAGVPLDVRWKIDLVHDHHVHESWGNVLGENGTWTPAAHEDGSISLIVTLLASDSQGLEVQRSLRLFDSDSRPHPHLVEVREPRLGHLVSVVAHSDYPTPTSGPRADLTFEWGDGGVDLFEDVADQADVTARHLYPGPGTYTLRVTATDNGQSESHEREVVVRKTRPAVAIFRPAILEGSVSVAEQEAIATELAARLAPESDVLLFDATEGAALADWVDANRADDVLDALVVIDLVPAALFAGESDGSRIEEWLEAGNALVCTGALPLGRSIDENGLLTVETRALDFVLDSGPYVGFGLGPESLQQGARSRLPSLLALDGLHSIQQALVAEPWRLRRAFTGSLLKASNAIELVRDGGGIYAQFYCQPTAGLPRAAVLGEYLEPLLRGKTAAR
jgi:PKD repeat protein